MTEAIAHKYNTAKAVLIAQNRRFFMRASFVTLLGAMTFVPFGIGAELSDIIAGSLSEAYLQVSVFVASTLLLFYAAEKGLGLDIGRFMRTHEKWQIPVAAVLGALPGCGGAIIVMTQYVRGYAGFGTVVAVLTSTMGDAAFLLLAKEPISFVIIFVLSLGVGSVSGFIVNAIHGPSFLRHEHGNNTRDMESEASFLPGGLVNLWWLVFVPGILIGGALAMQIDIPADLVQADLVQADLVQAVGLSGAFVALGLWACQPKPVLSNAGKGHSRISARVVSDTNFVTFFVIIGYLTYELFIFSAGIDLTALFKSWAPVVPLLALLIGFIPGCGPQIVVTSLYLNGLVPFSAQLANAISNDGDALFPAIALSPKAAIAATLYTAIPACLVGYGYYFLFEL